MCGSSECDSLLLLEKLSLITNEECVESNILPVEAMKFLEEEALLETVTAGPTGNEQDGEEEDLVSERSMVKITVFYWTFLFILVRSDLEGLPHTSARTSVLG